MGPRWAYNGFVPDLLTNFITNILQNLSSADMLNASSTKALIAFGIIFIFAIFMAIGRRVLISSSLEGVWAGFIIGMIFVGALEGLIFWGAKSFVFGDRAESLPKGVQVVLSGGQENLNRVLGVKTEKKNPTAQSVVTDFGYLGTLDAKLAKGSICKGE